MNHGTDVSVLVPTRNRWAMLSRTLWGGLQQRGVELELLVVDDSTDEETARGIEELRDARVRRLPGRARGVSDARNLGIQAARGAWIAFLDDDDLWSPDKLRLQLDAARAQSAVYAYAAAVSVDARLQVVRGRFPSLPRVDDVRKQLLLANVIPASCSNVLVRADVAQSVPGFDPRLAQVADWDMWLQLAERGRAAALPEVLVAYMQHGDNMLLGNGGDPFEEFEILRRKHDRLSRELGVPFSRAHFARWVATRHRRAGERMAAARLLAGAGSLGAAGGVGNLTRALGALLGEPVVDVARRVVPGSSPARPAWLSLYERR